MSIAGGYHEAVKRAVAIGANAVQLFSSSPRDWYPPIVSDAHKELFLQTRRDLGVNPAVFHASYLLNLADTDYIGKKSVEILSAELQLAKELDILGSVVHVGSFKNGDEHGLFADDLYTPLLKNMETVLKRSDGGADFLIENSATKKIGRRLEEIAYLITTLDHPCLKVCLDTCHLHAAGYDLSSQESFTRFVERFDELIGLSRLSVIHLNDSKDTFGSNRDRHENIGQGSIDMNVFRQLVNHPQTKDTFFVIETPGLEKKGPDKPNIDTIKSLIA